MKYILISMIFLSISCSVERNQHTIPGIFDINDIKRDLEWNGHGVSDVKIFEWRLMEDHRPLKVAEIIGSLRINGEMYLFHSYKHPNETSHIPKWEWSIVYDAPCDFLVKYTKNLRKDDYNNFKTTSWWNKENSGFNILDKGSVTNNLPR